MADAGERRRAQRANARAQKSGGMPKTSIGAKARAVATSLRNGTQQHLSSQQFGGGKHAAPSSYGSAKKNAAGDSGYSGKHAQGASTGRHAGGYSASADSDAVAKTGSSTRGKHAA